MPRALIFLLDGTGNDPTADEPSNVFLINSLIAESRRVGRQHRSQVTFYLPGIGTTFTSRGLSGKIRQLVFGDKLDEMVMRSYVNLAANYREGDQIAVLGFSRGAVAARLFCRLIVDFGLLKAQSLLHFPDMYDAFVDAIDARYVDYQSAATAFREKYARQLIPEPQIGFLGLFDCVAGPTEFATFLKTIDEKKSPNIGHYFHLMSLHDMRAHFVLSRMNVDEDGGCEVWMPGVHSDVGGGYAENALSQISLLTMAIRLREFAGIALDTGAMHELKHKAAFLFQNRLVVNKESALSFDRNRNTYFGQGDKLHYIHQRMVGQTVYWKEEDKQIYDDRFSENLAPDIWTESVFSKLLRA